MAAVRVGFRFAVRKLYARRAVTSVTRVHIVARRMYSPTVSVRCGALCDDHVLLLGDDAGGATVRGFGYNRYGQAAPGDGRLRVAQPTTLPLGLFGAQVPVAVAVGGGASAALTVNR